MHNRESPLGLGTNAIPDTHSDVLGAIVPDVNG